MAVSLNSVISFYPNADCQQITKANIRVSLPKLPCITSLSRSVGLRQSTLGKRSRFNLLATGSDNVATETTDTDFKTDEGSDSSNGSSGNVSDVNSSATDEKVGSTAKSSSTVKRASLTARERLRAARVLSRYTESKPSKDSKPQLSSKLLEALKETEKGKRRPGLPEAPTDLFDDSKRGLPTQGWKIDIPGGMDVFFIVFSFVFISSVMFATTYIVWKVGAIHFNEY